MSAKEKLEKALGVAEDLINDHDDNLDSNPPEADNFEIIPAPERKSNLPALTDIELTKNDSDDYVHVRETFHHLVGQGQEALAGALKCANESMNPRAFEVVAQLIKTVSEVSKEITDLNEQRKGSTNSPTIQEGDVTNNYVITTHEQIMDSLGEEFGGKMGLLKKKDKIISEQ